MLASLRARGASPARWARASGGLPAAAAMSDYQLAATELALARAKADRGVLDFNAFAAREHSLLSLMAVARHAFAQRVPGHAPVAPAPWAASATAFTSGPAPVECALQKADYSYLFSRIHGIAGRVCPYRAGPDKPGNYDVPPRECDMTTEAIPTQRPPPSRRGLAPGARRWSARRTPGCRGPASATRPSGTSSTSASAAARVRIRLSNVFGDRPLRVDGAHVAIRLAGAATVPGTGRAVTFGGAPSVIIPAGERAWSDPVRLRVDDGADLAVSLYVPAATGPATWHPAALCASYHCAPGDHAADRDPRPSESEARRGSSSTAWTCSTPRCAAR